MKKILTVLCAGLLCTGLFAQTIETETAAQSSSKETFVESSDSSSHNEENNNSNEFFLGMGLSMLSPEINFCYRRNHFEVQTGFSYDTTGLASWFTSESVNFFSKTNIGYVFDELEKSKIRFSTGGNIDICTGFTAIPIVAVGAYGKMSRVFGKHFELSGETYLPLMYTNTISDLVTNFSADHFLNYAGWNVFTGLLFTAVYAKYRF